MDGLKMAAKIIKSCLPHAFDFRYWDLADTTYKEEIALAFIEENKLKGDTAKRFLKQCGLFKKDYPILYFWVDGHIEEGMGVFTGITPIGKKFINDHNLNQVKRSYR